MVEFNFEQFWIEPNGIEFKRNRPVKGWTIKMSSGLYAYEF